MLTADDEAYLKGKRYEFEVRADQGLICVVITNYELPPGFDRPSSNLLLRLPQGFPDAPPDMFWFTPPIRLQVDGSFPPAAAQMEQYLGEMWQRFSRHLNAGAWRPGTDNLASYLALIGAELERVGAEQ
jgi:hypothetical protein